MGEVSSHTYATTQLLKVPYSLLWALGTGNSPLSNLPSFHPFSQTHAYQIWGAEKSHSLSFHSTPSLSHLGSHLFLCFSSAVAAVFWTVALGVSVSEQMWEYTESTHSD